MADSFLDVETTEPSEGVLKSWGVLSKEMLKVAVPYSLAGFIIEGSAFTNVLILSNLGDEVLAASALFSVMQLFTLATSKASLTSTSVMAARSLNQPGELGVILQQSWLQSLIISVPIIVLYFSSKALFLAVGQDPELTEIAGNFLFYYTITLPAMLLLKSNEMFSVGTKHTTLVLIVMAINNVATLLLSYVMVLGKLGVPEYGIYGSVAASTISNWLCFILMTLYFRFNNEFKSYNIFNIRQRNRIEILKNLFLIGLPVAFQMCIEASFIFIKTIFTGKFGKSSLTADQVANQYMSIFLEFNIILSTVTGVMVSSDIGSNNSVSCRRISIVGMLFSGVISLIGLFIFLVANESLGRLFLNSESENYLEILTLVKSLLIINSVVGLFDAPGKISAGSLRGFYDTLVPSVYTLFGLCIVGILSSYLLSFPIGLGVVGLAIGRGFGVLSTSIGLFLRWYTKTKDPNKFAHENKTFSLMRLFPCGKTPEDPPDEQEMELIQSESLTVS